MSVVKGKSVDPSPVLFLNTKGEPMRFFIRPGPTKMQLQPLIANGGGILCRTQESSAILLADPGDSIIKGAKQFYISTQYIYDCVTQDQQLDIEKYRNINLPAVQTRSASQKRSSTGRMGYSVTEDQAILDFIAKRRNEAKGNRIWKEMKEKGVTCHSWQSMKDRFLKHLQNKNMDKSPEKRNKLEPLKDSSSSDDNVSQTSPERKKTTTKPLIYSSSESDIAQISPDVQSLTEGTPEHQPALLSSSVKRNTPQHESVKNLPRAPADEVEKEPLKKQDQESSPVQEKRQCQQESEQPDVSPKRARVDEDVTRKETSNGPSDRLATPTETRRKAIKNGGKKLGILERAAREFEDSQVVEDESHEDRPLSRASSNTSDTDECQIVAARERAVREQKGHTEHCNAEHHAPQAQSSRCMIEQPGDDGPGPSNAVIPVTSNAHLFLFEQESQEDLSQCSQTETLSPDVLKTKQYVVNLMQESKKDLVQVMKALLKASGDVPTARTYLLNGYDHKVHGPIWTRHDDEVLLADSSNVVDLNEKYGPDRVSKRLGFLQAR